MDDLDVEDSEVEVSVLTDVVEEPAAVVIVVEDPMGMVELDHI